MALAGRRSARRGRHSQGAATDGTSDRASDTATGAPPGEEGARKSRRWRRRALIIGGSLLGVVIIIVGGIFFYARWRYDQIKKIPVKGLVARIGNQPFDVLLVGSDSRQFVDSTKESDQYGNTSNAGGQRSDVIIVARIAPALHEVKVLSIPRDTYVDIPGNSDISGPNRINAAFNSGAPLLVQTIGDSFHLPVSNFVEVNFPGLVNMVNAVGGVYLDFKYPVRDLNSHLGITRVGCHLVRGSQALALVRSRDLSYEVHGVWHYDGWGDLSRIRRQDAFFRALIPRLDKVVSSPTGVNALLDASVKNLTFDKTLSESEVLGLASIFHSMGSSGFTTETLPTIPWVTPNGEDVQIPATQADEQMLSAFLAFGNPKPKARHVHAATTTAASTTTTSAATTTASTATASTTVPAASSSSGVTVTTVPSTAPADDVETNNQPEPWNPVPCNP